MSRLCAIFMLMFAFVWSAGATTFIDVFDAESSCSVMADDAKQDGTKEAEEEAEPECD